MRTTERTLAGSAKTTTDRNPTSLTSGLRRLPPVVMLSAVWIAGLCSTSLASEPGAAASASRGRVVLEERQCLACHSIAGEGVGTAGDLGRRSLTMEHSPAGLAALIWNHGPSMWDRMRKLSMEVEPLSTTEADDLMAYFWSLRFFDPRGEAIRGKTVFAEKRCGTCHSLTAKGAAGDAPPVSEWEGVADPTVWAQELWKHSKEMKGAMTARGMAWPEFNEQEMVDLLIYLQNLPATRDHRRRLVLSLSPAGKAMFEAKACGTCHSLDADPKDRGSLRGTRHDFNTMTGFSAAMWNHATQIDDHESQAISIDEMNELISGVYYSGGFEEKGNPDKGRRLFEKRGCQSCHGDHVPKDRQAGNGDRFSAASMVAAAWSHGPGMLRDLQERGRGWPELSGRDVADLVAYLDQDR